MSSSINDLPKELLGQILTSCLITRESFTCLIIGKEGNSEVLEVKEASRIQVQEQYSRIVKSLKETSVPIFTTTTPPTDHGDTPPENNKEEGLREKLGQELVQKLSLMGKLQIQLPVELCPQLSRLHIHLSTLKENTNFHLNIPTLKSFLIDSYGMSEYWDGEELKSVVDIEKLMNAVINILQENTFPHLEFLLVDVPFCAKSEKGVVAALSSFLGRHHATIQSFCYHQGFKIKISKEEKEDVDEVDLPSLAASAHQLKNVFLKDLHIGLYTPQESDPLWINFLIQQSHMSKAIFTGNPIPFPTRTLQVNQATLTTIIMELRDNVDIKSLKDCAQLKKLSLLGDYVGIFGNGGDSDSEEDEIMMDANINVINLELLPLTVQELKIHRLRIDTAASTELICSGKWVNLRKLELIDVGVEGKLGVSLRAIAQILESKQLQWFQICFSLNRKSTEQNLPESLQCWAYSLQFTTIRDFQIRGTLSKDAKKYEIQEEDAVYQAELFTFPEEISPTGFHCKAELTEEDNNSESDTSGEDEDSNSSSYENIDEDEDKAVKEA